MQGISKLAMGSAVVVAVCLLLVFLLLLMLYVHLCCSFLWQRRRCRRLQSPLPTTTTSGGSNLQQHKSQGDDGVAAAARDEQKSGSPGSPPLQKPAVWPTAAAACYAHGVLQTPASFFFTSVPHGTAMAASTKQGEVPSAKASLHFIGLIPSPRSATKGVPASGNGTSSCAPEDDIFCISNPIFDGTRTGGIGAGDDDDGGSTTPFETPDTSPSRLEAAADDDEVQGEGELEHNGEGSPPLKPMKMLPPALPVGTPAACLADGRRSLATSISATDTTNRPSSSSSSSNSPSNSPSW